MKDKLFIFMCSLVLTLAATGSALAAGSNSGDQYCDKPPDQCDNDKNPCPATSPKKCSDAGGYYSHSGTTKVCVIPKHKKAYCSDGYKGYMKSTTTYTKVGGKCDKKDSEKEIHKCYKKDQSGYWKSCDKNECETRCTW